MCNINFYWSTCCATILHQCLDSTLLLTRHQGIWPTLAGMHTTTGWPEHFPASWLRSHCLHKCEWYHAIRLRGILRRITCYFDRNSSIACWPVWIFVYPTAFNSMQGVSNSSSLRTMRGFIDLSWTRIKIKMYRLHVWSMEPFQSLVLSMVDKNMCCEQCWLLLSSHYILSISLIVVSILSCFTRHWKCFPMFAARLMLTSFPEQFSANWPPLQACIICTSGAWAFPCWRLIIPQESICCLQIVWLWHSFDYLNLYVAIPARPPRMYLAQTKMLAVPHQHRTVIYFIEPGWQLAGHRNTIMAIVLCDKGYQNLHLGNALSILFCSTEQEQQEAPFWAFMHGPHGQSNLLR